MYWTPDSIAIALKETAKVPYWLPIRSKPLKCLAIEPLSFLATSLILALWFKKRRNMTSNRRRLKSGCIHDTGIIAQRAQRHFRKILLWPCIQHREKNQNYSTANFRLRKNISYPLNFIDYVTSQGTAVLNIILNPDFLYSDFCKSLTRVKNN